MPKTIPRQASKPVQQITSATVVSNLGPKKNLKHMRSNILVRCGHALSVIKSQKVMTNTLFTNTTGPNMRGGTCTSALLTPVPLMGTHMVMMNSTLFGGICRRTMVCGPPWVVQNVMAPFAADKPSRNIYQPAWAKRISLAPNRPHMQRKSSNVMSVQRNIPHRLYYSSKRRCTEALTSSMCAACMVELSTQPQPCTNMKRYIKVTKVFKPNSKFQISNIRP